MTLTRVQALRDALWHADFKTLKELSAELRVAEKELPELLEKLTHTLKHETKRLQVDPARCIACGFEFNARERFGRPSRCPTCRSERIAPARVRIPE